MKSKRRFIIIGIPVIMLALVLTLAFALRLVMVEWYGSSEIRIWYLIGKDENRYSYRQLAQKHSLAKFSKIKMEMRYDEMIELAGKPTNW
ncbi:MAG: hypothetical protein FWB94_12545, partial [Chitinispirillia bacterium]|nr:hypothetical protein [Chitinispirillia bacterium]